MSVREVIERTRHLYPMKNPRKAQIRDLRYLDNIGAIDLSMNSSPSATTADDMILASINLEWPTQITETEFFERVRNMPKGKAHGFLSG